MFIIMFVQTSGVLCDRERGPRGKDGGKREGGMKKMVMFLTLKPFVNSIHFMLYSNVI